MNLTSNGIPFSLDDIMRYELPIDNPDELIKQVSDYEEIKSQRDLFDSSLSDFESLTTDISYRLDKLVDSIDEIKKDEIRNCVKILKEISTDLYDAERD